jgi:quinohemoprotein ethanol dehydrogenase
MFTVPGLTPEIYDPKALASLFGTLPPLATLRKGIEADIRSHNVLRAIDPVSGKIVWQQPSATFWDGGVLSTAGNLVVQGDAAGQLNVYAADSGRLLKRIELGTSVMAAPMSYRVKGQQYVAVLAGYGGGNIAVPFPPESAAYRYGNEGRLIVLKVGGGAVPKPAPIGDVPFAEPAPRPSGAAEIARGEVLYNRFCGRCHIFDRAVLPDLRRMSAPTNQLFYEIVLNGAYVAKGMGRWDDVLTRPDAEAIHAYIVEQAWQAYDQQRSTTRPKAP